MSRRVISRSAIRAAVASLILLTAAQAGAEEIFGRIAGQWAGNGTITFMSGTRERIRCRAEYTPSNQDRSLRLELRCASDSYKFELRSDLISNNGTITGVWTENTRNVAGTISGKVLKYVVDVIANSPTFSAFLRVSTSGNRQSVSIRSPGSEMQDVSISLARR